MGQKLNVLHANSRSHTFSLSSLAVKTHPSTSAMLLYDWYGAGPHVSLPIEASVLIPTLQWPHHNQREQV